MAKQKKEGGVCVYVCVYARIDVYIFISSCVSGRIWMPRCLPGALGCGRIRRGLALMKMREEVCWSTA